MAEEPPLQDESFLAVQLSVALHEFPRRERELVLRQSLRLLKPGGWLVIVDLHPAGPWLRLSQQLFCALFETDTATSMLEDDLPSQLQQLGFTDVRQELLHRNMMREGEFTKKEHSGRRAVAGGSAPKARSPSWPA